MTATVEAMAVVGTDLVRIARIDESLRRFGERFVRRVFTQAESSHCDRQSGPLRAASYAARFAGKEAVMKAIGESTLVFTDIEIVRDGDGRPGVRLHGHAVTAAARRGLSGLAVSLSHEDEYAYATAVGLCRTGGPRDTGEADHASGRAEGRGAAVPDQESSAATCRVRLLDEEDASFPRVREVYRIEQANQGRVRHMTRATAGSVAAWQATTKALLIYASLRRLDAPLVDLVCLYTSLLNGCAYCIDDAAGEALRKGWECDELRALGGNHASAYPPAVVTALRYAAVVAQDPHGADDELVDEVRSRFGGDEGLLELTSVLAMKNFWNRFATALRIPAEGKCADATLMADLLALSRTLRLGREAGCSTESAR